MDISHALLMGAYTPTYRYDYDSVRPIPYTQASIASLINQNDLNGLMAAVNDLTAYEAACRSYYDTRVSRTSGGKRDRLRSERTDLCNEALAAIRLATAGINSVQAKIAAQAKASLPAYVDNNSTNQTWQTPGSTNNPTAAIPVSQPQSQTAALVGKLAIPAAIAAAAFFLIKGH